MQDRDLLRDGRSSQPGEHSSSTPSRQGVSQNGSHGVAPPSRAVLLVQHASRREPLDFQ